MIGDTVFAEYVLMLKAACQCKGRDAVTAVERITAPSTHCCPQTASICMKSHRGAELVTQLPQGLETPP
jgi:hypothetical protein